MDFESGGGEVLAKHGVFGEEGIVLNNFRRFGAGGFDHFQILDRFHAKVGEAPLLVAGEFAGAALGEVEFG